MNKITTAVAIVTFLIIGGWYAGETLRNTRESDTLSKESVYFAERLTTLGIEDVGLPVEGFDPGMLMLAFPGLVNSDFEGVESFEGRYAVKGDMLEYVRSADMPITSAERTVSEKGYATLLLNISKRSQIDIVNEESVDAIVAFINTSDVVAASLNEGASALGVKVTPLSVKEDSRCPVDVQCIQAGTVRLEATLESGLGLGTQIFTLGEAITTEAQVVVLERVEPAAKAGEDIEPGSYRFYFRITKR